MSNRTTEIPVSIPAKPVRLLDQFRACLRIVTRLNEPGDTVLSGVLVSGIFFLWLREGVH